MIVLADIVDWAALRDVIFASLIAGVGVTLCFSLGILGVTRFADMRRAEKPVQASVYALLGVLGMGASLLMITLAIIEMTSKG